jgi:hypothetical protein
MSMYRQTYAELRRWRRRGNELVGYVYNDPNDFYDDGDEFYSIFSDDCLTDHGQFYMLRLGPVLVLKLMKDDGITIQ